jgi:hypothetical protein
MEDLSKFLRVSTVKVLWLAAMMILKPKLKGL